MRIISEQAVDILERTIGCFRVKEIDDRDERGVEDGPNDIESPLQGLDADRCYFDHHKVTDPVHRCPGGCAFRPIGKGVDFGGIEPGDSLPAYTEEDVVEEEESNGSRGDFRGGTLLEDFTVPDKDRDHEVAKTLAGWC